MRTGVVALTLLFLLIVAAWWTRDIAEAQTSTPAIQTSYYISDADQRVYVNDTFTIRFAMRRTSGGDGHGGISVSFPGLDQANSSGSSSSYDSPKARVVTDSYTNGSQKVSYFASGYSPIHRADGTQQAAEYLLVETDDTSWPLNTYRTLELEVTPKTTDSLIINYRYWLCGNGYQNCTYGPDSGSVDRQQGWHVDTFRVLVRNREPTATRVSPTSRDVELEPGSRQTFTARGRDRDGNLSQVEWHLNDESSGGQSLVPTGEYADSATHSFPNAGTYRVSVTFTDTIGESDTTYWDVEVSDDIDVTVTSDPPRRTITVDGTDRMAPYTTAWDSDTRLTLDAPSPQNVSGVNDRYVFSHWSHGGSQRQTVRPTTDTTYTANFDLQHFVSTRTEPRGVGIAGGGWYDHGSTARIGPAPTLTGLQFSHWQKGDGETIGSDPVGVMVTVDAAFLVEAVYTDASAPTPHIDSLGCTPTTVQVGETVYCRPELSGGIPTGYDWDTLGGSPSSATTRDFSTHWNTLGSKRIDFDVCNDSGCDSQSQTIVVGSGEGTCFTNWGTLPRGNTSVSGSWDGSCASTSRSGPYGRFYSFTLNQRTRVQIDLTSPLDTYLYLLSGSDSLGTILYEDDDGGTGRNDSHLDVTLERGTYTIEATTFSSGVTGNFSLNIHATAATANCFQHRGTLTAGDTRIISEWTGECASTNEIGSYARFYAFALTQRTRVRIDLSSSADTYLYLLRGADSEGTALASNNDGGTGTNSRLDLTLDAGTYTIEATTYDAAVTGNFSLTINLAEELVFTLTADPQPDLSKLAELQAELERQEAELNQGNPSQPIEIPLLEMLRRVDHTAIFVVEPDDEDSDYDARFNLAVAGTENDVTVTITASAERDITILHSGGLFGTDYNEEFDLEGSLTVRITDAGSRVFEIVGECLAEGGFASILIADQDGQMVDEGAILCDPQGVGAMPEPPLLCIQALPRFSPFPGVSPIEGQWASDCLSEHRAGSYARYYSFTLPATPPGSSTEVIITLESTVDTYLYLLAGEGTGGSVIASNDNGPHRNNYSQISEFLDSGVYTVEATTNRPVVAAEFSLTVSYINVSIPAPRIDDMGCAPLQVTAGETVSCRPTILGGEPTQFLWGAIGGDPWSGTSGSFSTQWDRPGEKRIDLEVCNDNGCDIGEQNITVNDPAPPDVPLGNPTNLRASAAGPGQVRLDWLPAPGAQEHWIWSVRNNGTGGKYTRASGSAATVAGLQTGQNYWFIIIAGRVVNGVQEWSQWSQWVSVRVSGTAVPAVIDDRAALVALYNATGGTNWRNNRNWLSAAPLNQWHGVTTDLDGRVVELSLTDNRLNGPVSRELGDLSRLTHASLNGNGLTGPIPSELGRLSNLNSLDLGHNQLSGLIPRELGHLSNLAWLGLESNQLSGPIPSELGGLAGLNLLFLQDNQLSGEIPPELGRPSDLHTLVLSQNRLSGEIPPELGDLSELAVLNLMGNQLTGPIRPELGGLGNLTDLNVRANQLDGHIPRELSRLTNLRSLDLSGNRIDGPIPRELADLSNLVYLNLSRNFLTGTIPPDLGNLTNLTRLLLNRNSLSGDMPRQLGNLSNLTVLSVRFNMLTGEIPSELGSLSRMEHLYLSHNQLTGRIPPQLGNLSNLTRLYIAGNLLTGCVPAALGDVQDNDFDELGRPFCGGASDVAPDLVIEDWVLSHPANPPGSSGADPGTPFDLTFAVSNRGNGRSISTTIRYYISSDAIIPSGDTEIANDLVSALGVNEEELKSISSTFPTNSGHYYYGACVDAVNGESNQHNNCSEAVPIVVRELSPVRIREETRCSWQILPFAEFKLEGTVEATRSLSNVVIKGFVTYTNSGGLRKREYAGQQDLGSMSANSISPFSIATAGPADFAPLVTRTHGCDYEFEWEP